MIVGQYGPPPPLLDHFGRGNLSYLGVQASLFTHF